MRAGGTPLPVAGRNKKAATFQRLLCDPGEARTLDPMIKSHLLYQLSYQVILFRYRYFSNHRLFLDCGCKDRGFIFPRKLFDYFFHKILIKLVNIRGCSPLQRYQ